MRPNVNSDERKLESKDLVKLADEGMLLDLVRAIASGKYRFLKGDLDATALYRRALSKLAERGAPAMVDALLTEAIAFDSELLLRAQTVAQRNMSGEDERFGMEPSKTVIEVDLPRLVRIEERIIALANAASRFAHVFALAKKEADAGQTAAKRRLKPSPNVIFMFSESGT